MFTNTELWLKISNNVWSDWFCKFRWVTFKNSQYFLRLYGNWKIHKMKKKILVNTYYIIKIHFNRKIVILNNFFPKCYWVLILYLLLKSNFNCFLKKKISIITQFSLKYSNRHCTSFSLLNWVLIWLQSYNKNNLWVSTFNNFFKIIALMWNHSNQLNIDIYIATTCLGRECFLRTQHAIIQKGGKRVFNYPILRLQTPFKDNLFY